MDLSLRLYLRNSDPILHFLLGRLHTTLNTAPANGHSLNRSLVHLGGDDTIFKQKVSSFIKANQVKGAFGIIHLNSMIAGDFTWRS